MINKPFIQDCFMGKKIVKQTVVIVFIQLMLFASCINNTDRNREENVEREFRTCPDCNGMGLENGDLLSDKQCEGCSGSGSRPCIYCSERGDYGCLRCMGEGKIKTTCSRCYGDGEEEIKCEKCNGEGRIELSH